jgi:hypothetical protein
MGVIVIGERGDGQTRDDRNIARVLESDSDLLLDNGADLIGETLRSGGSSRRLGVSFHASSTRWAQRRQHARQTHLEAAEMAPAA